VIFGFGCRTGSHPTRLADRQTKLTRPFITFS
jgi:hypothetical protein